MARDPRDPSASPAGIAPQRAFWIGFRTLVILGEFGRFRVLCMRRELLKNITRMVVKLGTGVLTDARKQPDQGDRPQASEGPSHPARQFATTHQGDRPTRPAEKARIVGLFSCARTGNRR